MKIMEILFRFFSLFEAHHAQYFSDEVISHINQYNDDRNGAKTAQLINDQQV